MMIPIKIFNLPISFIIIIFIVSFLRNVLTQSLAVESTARSIIRCLDKERQVLLNLKKELIDDYRILSSWGEEENKRECCRWSGVRCDNRTNHVVRLDLHARLRTSFSFPRLSGNISPSLVELQYLNYLDLSFNNFRNVRFPEFIGSINELRYLNLSYTYFRGPIPPHLGNLTKLQYLDLRGSTEDELITSLDWFSPGLHSLKYLDLGFANLSRVTNWLQVFGTLPSIEELHLSECDLPEINNPSSLPSTNVSTSLVFLDLSWNNHLFSSSSRGHDLIFYWFLNMSHSLTSLDLSSTLLESSNIPNAFQNMERLAHLDLSGNIEVIPEFIGNMSCLIDLKINSNFLTGQLSELMMNLYGPLENRLQYLDLGQNSLSGPLPNISRFSFLNTLILQENQLNGTITEGFLHLPNLAALDLSWNQITGPVPNLSFSTKSLRYLFLNDNRFKGTVTKSIGHLSKLEALSLGSNQLEGAVTEAHVANLLRLQELDLSSNLMLNVTWNSHFVPPFQLYYMNLAGCKLGPQFSKLLRTQKELIIVDISDTQFSDTISNMLNSLPPTLLSLNASINQITGFIPNHISFSNISISPSASFSKDILKQGYTKLDLSRNKILGSIQFLCNHTKLTFIDLSDNFLSTHLPDCFANFEYLQHLNLANNQFSGKIPPSFGRLKSLYSLHLQNNNFSGEIPTSMRNCKNLFVIELGENRLTGKVPSWIGNNLSMLQILVLRSNAFSGSVPSNLCKLQHIRVLDLSSNKISGEIPKCLSNLTAMTKEEDEHLLFEFDVSESLHHSFSVIQKFESANRIWKREMVTMFSPNLGASIDLSSNNLVGEIPDEITELVGLLLLNFSRNELMGPIPINISHLKLLDTLDLSRNKLSGAIPSTLSELSHLGILDLSFNNLSGRIPREGHLLTFNDESTYVGNLGLCGPPLNTSCPGDIDAINNSKNDHEGKEEDEFISDGFYICMGLGFFVGFWGILGTIMFNKAFRYSFFKVMNSIGDFIYVRVQLSKIRLRRQFLNAQGI